MTDPTPDYPHPSDPISPASLQHFHALPWAHTLLSAPDWHLLPNWSYTPKPAIKEDLLIGRTLASRDTIPHCLMLYHTSLTELKILLRVEPGLNGYADIMHGGIIATMIDEYSGCLISLGQHVPGGRAGLPEATRRDLEERTGVGAGGWDTTLTAKLEIEYKRPVETPGDYLLRLGFAGREGRRVFMEGVVEDGEGRVYAKGRTTWVGVKRGRL